MSAIWQPVRPSMRGFSSGFIKRRNLRRRPTVCRNSEKRTGWTRCIQDEAVATPRRASRINDLAADGNRWAAVPAYLLQFIAAEETDGAAVRRPERETGVLGSCDFLRLRCIQRS